jgi:hypothetical protein
MTLPKAAAHRVHCSTHRPVFEAEATAVAVLATAIAATPIIKVMEAVHRAPEGLSHLVHARPAESSATGPRTTR